MKRIFSILIFFFLIVVSCTPSAEEKSPDNDSPIITNPNGMSEMSLIMEEWYIHMKNISAALSSGKLAQNIPDAEAKDIYKAKTSKPDVHSEQFDSFVGSFFYNYSQISKASSVEEQKSEFNLTVKSCLNCHEQYCHGPMVRIKKLTVKQSL